MLGDEVTELPQQADSKAREARVSGVDCEEPDAADDRTVEGRTTPRRRRLARHRVLVERCQQRGADEEHRHAQESATRRAPLSTGSATFRLWSV